MAFYRHLAARCEDDARGSQGGPGFEAELVAFLPRFRGVCTHEGLDYLKLGNVCAGYAKPCQMDVKLGVVTYPRGASEKKIRAETASWPPQATLGFRFCGLETYDVAANTFEYRTRRALRSHNEEAVPAIFADFVGLSRPDPPGHRGYARGVAGRLAERLRGVVRWFEAQTCYGFTASSALLVYEGHPAGAARGGQAGLVGLAEPAVVLIDFAHVAYDTGEHDTNVLVGLRTLVNMFQQLADEEERGAGADGTSGQSVRREEKS